MSQDNSPMYDQGRADALEDDQALANCPPGTPMGPRPPYPAFPTMYLRGYNDNFIGVPHICTSACRKAEDQDDA